MNKLTLEKIATPLLKACKEEGLMYKEAAKIFNTEPAYFKMLEREDKREAIPEKVMDRFHSWVYSGKKLKEYKMPENSNLPTSDPDMIPGPGEIVIGPFKSVAELTKAVAEHEKKAKRKKEPKAKFVYPHEKPKRKYTRKPKENPPAATQKIMDDVPVPTDKHYTGAPDIPVILLEKSKRIITEWLLVCPERQMIDNYSIRTIAEKYNIPESFVKAIIETEIAKDEQLIPQKEQKAPDSFPVGESNNEVPVWDNKPSMKNPNPTESETGILKSEIKTLSFLLAREHEAAEVLRAENGYLNARITHNANRATEINNELQSENSRLHKMLKDIIMPEWSKDNRLEVFRINEELKESLRKLKNRGFWARVFNRPGK